MGDTRHIRNQYLTIYGKKPVMEMLEESPELVAKIFVTKSQSGKLQKEFSAAIKKHSITWHECSDYEVSRISKSPKQDQGIAADIKTPHFDGIDRFIEKNGNRLQELSLLALDQITTPANVGMIVRSATALGIDGIIIPYKGCAKLSSLVVKASAGVLLKSTVLRSPNLCYALSKLKEAGMKTYGLSGEKGGNIYQQEISLGSVFVLGNETHGLSLDAEKLIDQHLSIPMSAGVESLNVACAATVVSGEICRVRQKAL